MLCIATETGSY